MPCQSGAALIVSLVILLVLTIIGVTAMQGTTLEERMAGNLRSHDLAFQAAAAALRNGENTLAGLGAKPDPVDGSSTACSSTPCVYTQQSLSELNDKSDDWWQNYGLSFSGNNLPNVAKQPRYVLQTHGYRRDTFRVGHSRATGTTLYRITAHGIGGSANARVTLQSVYAKRFN